MAEFRMPTLGADMEAGTLVEWIKRPGDAVVRGDIIAVVDTQKGAIEIEVFEDGVLDRVMVQPGDRVPVGTVMATIQTGGAATPSPAAPPEAPPERLRASPAAKKLAAERDVDLAQLRGTGPGGVVTLADVEQAAVLPEPTPQPAPAAAGAHTTPASPQPLERAAAMRTAIAAAMARSKREIPHYYLSTTIDMRAALGWLRSENEGRPMPDRLLAIALFVKTVGLALHEAPELNGHWVDGGFRKGTGIHVGCAIALRGGGLVAPAVHDADRKDLTTLMREIRDLVGRARGGSIKSSELADPTITVTNLGEQGVDTAFGIIYPPQVALVGFGRIAERPWAAAGAIDVRPVMMATLSADHRASDGHRGGVFLMAIDRLLQAPGQL